MLRRTRGRVVQNEHTVVLGWTDRTLFLLGELAEMFQGAGRGRRTIVVLGELEREEMMAEIAVTFPHWKEEWPLVSVICREGKPYEVRPSVLLS